MNTNLSRVVEVPAYECEIMPPGESTLLRRLQAQTARRMPRTQTATVNPTWPALPSDLAGCLWLGAEQHRGYDPQSAVANLLLHDREAGLADLTWAASTDLATQLEADITTAQILTATHDMVVVGFEAQRAYFEQGDPVHVLLPWGAAGAVGTQHAKETGYNSLIWGLQALLDGRLRKAQKHFTHCGDWLQFTDPFNQLLLRRVLAVNFGFVVKASRA
jgi:hypothetical protein